MRYYFLLLLIALASFFLAASISAICVHLTWPRVADAVARLVPPARARMLLTLRLLPSFTGVMAAALLGGVFLTYEPAGTTETPGLLLMLTAAVALWLVLGVMVRGARSVSKGLACARLMQHCRRLGRNGASICIVDSTYPVAAVAGVFRTRLVLSDRLLRECAPEEIEAILAHEWAHVGRADNLTRALMLSLPDVLGLLGAGRAIEAAWAVAAEEAADDEAAGEVAENRAALASALVRVARMAETAPPDWMPALAFYQGDNLDRRVRRLLDPVPAGAPSMRGFEPTLIAVALLVVIWSSANSERVHLAMEWMVGVLP